MRKIIHIDMDCFYAAVEVRDNPSLRSLPIAVGGRPERRGVIATCNYIARDYGVRSAMSSAHAIRLCRELVILPPNLNKYRQVSRQIHDVFSNYTSNIEPLSLDEAYLDVSQSKRYQGSATLIAKAIKSEIFSSTGLVASAGVAPNKFLAKVASDWKKPDGLFVITPEQVDSFMLYLPIKKIPGVGKITEQKLLDINIRTCGDLQAFTREALVEKYGQFGESLFRYCRGKDTRSVKNSSSRKSSSRELTLQNDILDIALAKKELKYLYEKFINSIDDIESEQVKSIFVKVKFTDFTLTRVETQSKKLELSDFEVLLEEAMRRKSLAIRLIGLGYKPHLSPTISEQSYQLEIPFY